MHLSSPWLSLLALGLMLGALAVGSRIRRRWPEHHSNRETIELLQTTVMMLATFAAIVLGLLITSAKTDFDDIENGVRSFSATLVQLDYSLEGLGAAGVPMRQNLARYTAAAIAAVWRSEPPPAGDYYPHLPASHTPGVSVNAPVLGQMLENINAGLETATAQSPQQATELGSARRLMNIAVAERWHLVEASLGSLSAPFFAMLVFWTLVIYLCFGLSAPLNHVNIMAMTLSALALSSALFVIIDLYTPFSGYFTVESAPMRTALAEMLAEPQGQPSALAHADCSTPPGCRPD